jgi:hypothetical protein
MKILSFKNLLILAAIGLPIVLYPLFINSVDNFSDYEPVIKEQFGEDALFSSLSIDKIERMGLSLNVTATKDKTEDLKVWNYFNNDWKERPTSGNLTEKDIPTLTLKELDLANLNTLKDEVKEKLKTEGLKGKFQRLGLNYSTEQENWIVEVIFRDKSAEMDYSYQYDLIK